MSPVVTLVAVGVLVLCAWLVAGVVLSARSRDQGREREGAGDG
jgi:hypothetical protein